MKRLGWIGLVLFVAAVLYTLAAVWRWALVGMSAPVGCANTLTIVALGTLGVTLIVVGSEPPA